MKFFIITALVASLAALAFSLKANPLDKKCVEMHCKDEDAACMKDSSCMKTVTCIDTCWKNFDNDTTPGKLVVQNCTNQCVFSNGGDVYEKTLTCIVTNNCLTFPSIPSMCKGPDNVKILKNITASEFSGDFNVLKGYNTVYDCYPCDKNSIDTSAGTVKISFDGIGVGGVVTSTVQASGTIKASPPAFNVSITEAAAPVAFTWWVFDRVDDTSGNKYYLIYYCGSTSMWNYDGAMVKSQATTISDSAMTAISSAFQTSVGLDFSKFCTPKVEGC